MFMFVRCHYFPDKKVLKEELEETRKVAQRKTS